MTWEGWVSLGVIGMVFALLIRGRYGADVIIVAGVSLLVLVGILTPRQAIAGLANEGVITVAIMYVVVCGLGETGAVSLIARNVLGQSSSLLATKLRMLMPVTVLSAFMNNTPLVAMFIPVINDWCRKHRVSPSKLMLPLSYAAMLGGTCTIIGTSTNLVVAGLWINATGQGGALEGQKPIGFFEIAWVGVPCATIGLIYLVIASKWLLPVRKPVLDVESDARSYTVEMIVETGSPLVGQTIEAAGLRHLPGLFLAEIERAGETIAAVGPDQRLAAEDRLVFVGVLDSVVELQKIRGLKPATDQVVKLAAPRPQRSLIEAVVSNSSPLVGRSVREGRFRSVYNAVVIAVARNGERVNKKIGDIVLRVGDTLLLEAHRSFAEQHKNSRDFFLVSRVENSEPVRHEKAFLSLGVLAVMVAIATIGPMGFGMIHAAVIAAGLMLVLRCCSGTAARRAVDWQVIVTIAASLALGVSLEVSGAAEAIAHTLVGLIGNNPWLTLLLIYGITMFFTEMITNNGAAALIFPVALSVSEELGVDFKPFAMCIMMAASASFSTPIGYQTNLMVMGPGGYRFTDYFRIGIPLNLTMWALAVAITPLFFPFK